jgi:uncharacterized protein YdiU (UPF0061 family)
MTVHFPFEHTYAALPANFFARVVPTPVASPRLIKLNRPLAIHLGLDPDRLASREGTEILAGKRVPEGADPIAMAYAGHQFGHFVPQLGDGRAILLGEVIAATSSSRGPARRRIPAAATAAPRSARSCANTLSARRWRGLAFRPRARLPRS